MGALMARKDLLKGLMSGDPPAREDAAPLPRYARGAIGAVSRSIADLKSRSLTEVPAAAIDDVFDSSDQPQVAEGEFVCLAGLEGDGPRVPAQPSGEVGPGLIVSSVLAKAM